MVGDLGILAQVTFFNEVPCPHRADCVRKLERGGAINVLAIVVAISTHRSHGSVGIVGRLPSPSGDRFRPDIDGIDVQSMPPCLWETCTGSKIFRTSVRSKSGPRLAWSMILACFSIYGPQAFHWYKLFYHQSRWPKSDSHGDTTYPRRPATSGPYRRGPCAPREPDQSVQGWGMGFPSRSPGLTWAFSTIRARAGRCREGGLSSTDERVSEGSCHRESQRLFGSHPNVPRVIHTYSRDDLNANRPRLDLLVCWTGFMSGQVSAATSAKHKNFGGHEYL
jgi:hypothetical protein